MNNKMVWNLTKLLSHQIKHFILPDIQFTGVKNTFFYSVIWNTYFLPAGSLPVSAGSLIYLGWRGPLTPHPAHPLCSLCLIKHLSNTYSYYNNKNAQTCSTSVSSHLFGAFQWGACLSLLLYLWCFWFGSVISVMRPAQVMWPMMDKCILEIIIFLLVAFRYDTEVTPPASKSNKQTELLQKWSRQCCQLPYFPFSLSKFQCQLLLGIEHIWGSYTGCSNWKARLWCRDCTGNRDVPKPIIKSINPS